MPVNEPKQTFIPKKSIGEKKDSPKRRGGGLFFGIALLVFILTAAASGGVYAYKVYLENRVDSMSADLERAKQAFEPSLIRELQRLNTRMDAADRIITRHVALSSLFETLGELTLKTVQFERFTYTFSEETVQITLQGKAQDYSSVALQSDSFAENPFVKNPIFSNLGLDETGNVTFDVEANIDPILISYKESLTQ